MFSIHALGLNSFAPHAPQWHVELPGFNNEKASQSYGQCILAGGNENDCAGKGFEAGANGNAEVEKEPGLWDRAKYVLLGGVGAITGNPMNTVTALNAAAAANKVGSLTVSRIATGIIGLLLIGGAMFMFGLASFNPAAKIIGSLKGGK